MMDPEVDPPRESAWPLAAGMADLMLKIRLDGRIAFASPSATETVGYAVAELIDRYALDFVFPDDVARVRRHFVRVRRRGTEASRPIAFRGRGKDGRPIWLEGNPSRLVDVASGDAKGWVDVLRDIEVRKAREIDLVAARRSAEVGAEDQAEFLANMSHEIRTPLNSILGFMQVLRRDGGLGAVQLGYVTRAEEAGRNLLAVVDDVLDLSKIESGAARLEGQIFSPAALAGDAVAMIRPQATDKGLVLAVEIGSAATAAVIGDQGRLRQILLNLLSNAVKFTPHGTVGLKLGARASNGALDLDFVVEDSGVGIASDQIPKLFRRFTQADGSIARRFGGTGLGLAISRRLVEAMGGSIDVESTLDVGSRFTTRLTLPLARPRPAAAQEPPAPKSDGRLRGKRLLLAEDVPINQKLVTALLEPLGCDIDVVIDGAEALRVVQREDYALVLMDMRMPTLDGVAASRAIRALGGRYADLPIIGLTANVFPQDIEQARQAGMNEVVTKPIDAERLVSSVMQWALHRQNDAVAPTSSEASDQEG